MTVKVDAHSELMTAYPWGFTGVTPNASDNLPDHAAFDGNSLAFTDDGSLPGAPEHHYTALVASTLTPQSGTVDTADSTNGFRGPQPGHACTGNETTAPMPQCLRRRPVRQGRRRRAGLQRHRAVARLKDDVDRRRGF